MRIRNTERVKQIVISMNVPSAPFLCAIVEFCLTKNSRLCINSQSYTRISIEWVDNCQSESPPTLTDDNELYDRGVDMSPETEP